jgi:hypothetical protein
VPKIGELLRSTGATGRPLPDRATRAGMALATAGTHPASRASAPGGAASRGQGQSVGQRIDPADRGGHEEAGRRDDQAVELRLAGYTYAQNAVTLGPLTGTRLARHIGLTPDAA